MPELALTTSRRINAPASRLFNAWLDPALVARFFMPMPGTTVPSASIDPQPGGRFDITMRDGDRDIPHCGMYKEITPHTRLVFTWESPFSAEGSEVCITFTPDGTATLVELTHVKFTTDSSRDGHARGWAAILAKLDAALGAVSAASQA